MNRPFEQALLRFGQSVRVIHGENETETKAFLQEALEKSETRGVTPLGETDGRRWVYIGGAETEIEAEDRVCCGELRLRVLQTEAVYLGDEICHRWARLEKDREAAQ